MALIRSKDIKDVEYLLTQTPPNYPTEQNYFLRELQQKIDADWKYRPNRIDIEEEKEFGEEDYSCLQVVVQSIKTDKGESVSDDWKRLVFKDLSKKLKLGTRYRFSSDFDPRMPNIKKNIWIAVNQNKVQATTSQVVVRCNGTLGSVWKDEQGNLSYHYEPVVQDPDFQGTGFSFNTVAIDPRGSMKIIAQNNKYTSQYYINQRFVIGYDRVFKIQNISRQNTLTTYDPKDVGLITLYLQMDQIGEKDNLETRIAYNGRTEELVPEPMPPEKEEYQIKITSPQELPQNLYSDSIEFKTYLFKNNQQEQKQILVECSIDGIEDFNKYVEIQILNSNSFSLRRKRFYGGANLSVKCFVPIEESPSGKEIYKTFQMNLGGLE